MSGPRE